MSSASQVQEQIYGLVKNEQYVQLAALCEDFELDVSNTKTQPFYAIQLFAYLLVDNLTAARLLWKRIADPVKSNNSTIGLVWNLAKQLILGDIAAFYAASTATAWSTELQPLNQKLLSVHRLRTLHLLAKSYDNITAASMAAQLGMSVDDAVRYATRLQWTQDEAGAYLQPPTVSQEAVKSIPLSNLATLTSYVVHLEQ